MSKNYVGISRDHSVSMRSIREAAGKDYNATIAGIREVATNAGQDTIVSVVKSGVGPSGQVVRESVNSSINVLTPIPSGGYITDGNSTPLFDSVGDLIEQFEATPDANNPQTSFLVMAITDGEENNSRRWTARRLMDKIDQLQRTDRWTFVFRVPKGYARKLSSAFNVPMGNILEWDQTDHGVQVATQATKEAFTQYYEGLKTGVRSTTKFYTNLADVDIKTVKAALVDVSGQVNLWLTSQKEVIKDFCEKMSKQGFVKGAAFYQLTKAEREVQDYKQIVLRDKQSGAVYGGAAARDLLGLPKFGTHPVIPGDHGQYDIYIQSTSVNRVLPPGTQLLYWPNFATPMAVPATAAKAIQRVGKWKIAPKAAPVPTKVVAQPVGDTDFIAGYKFGFDAGKIKSLKTTASVGASNQFREGYLAGYKDGRGKKKRLYK
jgi:hypothetical protein